MIRRAVLAVLAPGDPVTFPELGDRLAARGVEVDGDQTLALAQDPAVVLWSRWRPEVVDVVVELVAAGQVVLEPCRPERYNGARLDLPLAPLRRPPTPLSRPCWLPVTVAVRGRYRLADPGPGASVVAVTRAGPGVNAGLTLNGGRRRREVETGDYFAFVRRALDALGRRVGDGRLEDLGELAALAEVLDRITGEVIARLRAEPWRCSWSEIGRELGVTRQAAQQRYGSEEVAGDAD